METGVTTEEDQDTVTSNLMVMKLKKAGKYSIRSNGEGDRRGCCSCCTSSHETGRCLARDKKCFDCGEKNHFAKSKACTRTSSSKGGTTKKVSEANEEEDFDQSDQDVQSPGGDCLARLQPHSQEGKGPRGG